MPSERPSLSPAFVATAEREAERLAGEVRRLREQWRERMAEAEALATEAARAEGQLRELEELLGRAPQMPLDLQDAELRGQRLSRYAIELLAKERSIGTPIHYRDWFDLVVDSGRRVVGRNPLASFLTEVSRSPLVERISSQSGTYRLNPQAAEAQAELRLRQAERLVSKFEDDIARAPEDAENKRALRAARRQRTAAQQGLTEIVSARSRLDTGSASALARPAR